jgi:hypothetical protein
MDWKCQIRRKGAPEEVAALIAWLVCDETRYITGTVQHIDGGVSNIVSNIKIDVFADHVYKLSGSASWLTMSSCIISIQITDNFVQPVESDIKAGSMHGSKGLMM